jgi:hypothetical protein
MTEKKYNVEWTPELEAKADAMVNEHMQLVYRVDPLDRAKAEASVAQLYRALGFEPVPCMWFDGPDDLLRQYAQDAGEARKAGEYARYYCDAQFSAWWFVRYEFALLHLPGSDVEPVLTQAQYDLARSCAGYLPTDVRCYLSERPVSIKVDAEHRPHSLDSAAILYRNGFGVYCVHGVMVPDRYITQRDKLTPSDVDAEENAEVRAALLQIYGMGRYLADSKAKLVHHVPDDAPAYKHKSAVTGKVYPYGLRGAKLWRRENKHGDIVQAVELLNSTAEVGGRRKTYWIGVTTQAQTVEEAVAASYGVSASEYLPEWET